MGRISPGPTRWPPGAERRLVPAKSNLKPQTSPGAPPPYPTYNQGAALPYQAPYPPGHHVHAKGASWAQPHQGQSLDPYHQRLPPPHPYVADPWRAGDSPPPQYQAAPREAPKDPSTPPDWPDSSDEAWCRKRRRSRSPPRTAHPAPAPTLPTLPPRLNHPLAPLPLPKAPPRPPGAPLPPLPLPQTPPRTPLPPH